MTRRQGLAISSVLIFLPASGMAQQDRISGSIDRHRMVVLKGNVQPNARPEFDQGPLDPTQKLTLVSLMLKPSAIQKAALDRLLTEQQDPFSPNYHKWLTPEEYADRFGLSQSDISKISAWLESEGFHVDDVARGRNWIVFSGSAAQVQSAFHTEIHRYLVDGESHFANATELSVPAAMERLVLGFRGLNDFHPKPASSHRKPVHKQDPHFTDNQGNNFLAS